jgi:triphosphatase
VASIPTETEIKLVFEPGLREEIEQYPAFAGAVRTARPRREVTTYFDTDDLLLHRHGYSLRIRKGGHGIVQTLKQASDDSMIVHRRNEWEWNLKNSHLVLQPVQKLISQSGLNGDLGYPKPRIVTDILRRRYEIMRDGCEIEAVIDEGVVRAGTREEPIHEVEVEVKRGPFGPACRLALELVEQGGLRFGAESKAERGYRLLTGCGTPPAKTQGTPFPPNATLNAALRWTIGAALNGFVANLPAARAGHPEGVHQSRVALRRARSALVLYAPCLDPCGQKQFSNAIRELGAVLGAVRDWDVFIDETLCAAAGAGVPANWIAALKEPAEAQRRKARSAVAESLDSKAPAVLVLGLEAWIGDCQWATNLPQPSHAPVRKIMPDLLDRLADKVHHRGRHLSRRSASELHPLRKSIKKLRYSAETTSQLYSRKRVNCYVDACKKLQTVLGTINDARVSLRLLSEIAPADCAALAAAAVAVQKWNTGRQSKTRSDLEKAWRRLKGEEPFWK